VKQHDAPVAKVVRRGRRHAGRRAPPGHRGAWALGRRALDHAPIGV